MPRLAIPYTPGVGRPVSTAGLPEDQYRDRLVKYLPAESVSFFTLTDKIFTGYYGINDAGEPSRMAADWLFNVLPWVLFVVGVVGTFIYLYNSKLPGQPWKVNVWVATIAFVAWAYTLDGSLFRIHHLYNELLAALAAPIVTFVAAALKPR